MRRITRIRQPSGWRSSSSSSSFAATRPIQSLWSQQQATRSNNVVRSPAAAFGNSRYMSSTTSNGNKQGLPGSLGGEEALEQTRDNIDDLSNDQADPVDTSNYVIPTAPSRAQQYEGISDPSYVPAVVSDGLETVGGLDGWWDKPEHFKTRFESFKPRSRIQDPEALCAGVKRALFETLALAQAGRNSHLTASWPIGVTDRSERQDRVLGLSISSDGTVGGDFQAVVKDLETSDEVISDLDSLDSPIPTTRELLKSAREQPMDEASWGAISLTDDKIKFAVIKRLFQLTGVRVPDHALADVTNASSLLQLIQKPPKSRTLTRDIQANGHNLINLPNVTVAAKRVTRGDKDKALGRYKVIQEEFGKRDLPLHGHGFVEKSKELHYLRGKA